MHLVNAARPALSGTLARLVQELRSRGTRDTATTLSGSLGRYALGFAASVIIARGLGPTAYGLIAIVSAVLAIVDTVGDFGLTYTAVRAVSRTRATDPERSCALANGYLSLSLLTQTLAMVGGALTAGAAVRLLGQEEAEPYVLLALFGLVPAAASGAVTALLQARSCFGAMTALQVVTGSTYLLGILALALVGGLSVQAVVLLGALNPVIGFLCGVRLLPAGLVRLDQLLAAPARRTWAELARFGRWIWLSSIFSLLASQLDLLLLSHYATAATVGVYALASNLAQKLDVINQARFTTLMPAVAELQRRGEISRFFRDSLKRGALLALGLGLASLIVLPAFIPIVYGSDFEAAINVLSVLLVVVLFDLVTSPIFLLSSALNEPRAVAAADGARGLVVVLVGVAAIPATGPIGAAVARLAGRVAGVAVMLIAVQVSNNRRAAATTTDHPV